MLLIDVEIVCSYLKSWFHKLNIFLFCYFFQSLFWKKYKSFLKPSCRWNYYNSVFRIVLQQQAFAKKHFFQFIQSCLKIWTFSTVLSKDMNIFNIFNSWKSVLKNCVLFFFSKKDCQRICIAMQTPLEELGGICIAMPMRWQPFLRVLDSVRGLYIESRPLDSNSVRKKEFSWNGKGADQSQNIVFVFWIMSCSFFNIMWIMIDAFVFSKQSKNVFKWGLLHERSCTGMIQI